MNVTWVMDFPNGHEQGKYLTVDLGGTNLRVCNVSLSVGKRDFEKTQRKYTMPDEVKSGTGEQLWDFIAEKVEIFLQEHRHGAEHLPLAFTFSFPVDQKSLSCGILQRWTKKFNVSGVEGQDVVPQLEAALQRRVSIPTKKHPLG